jgi:hypothetical protein
MVSAIPIPRRTSTAASVGRPIALSTCPAPSQTSARILFSLRLLNAHSAAILTPPDSWLPTPISRRDIKAKPLPS